MFDILECHLRPGTSKALALEARCKALARTIKSRRAPPWPCPPTRQLPARAVADVLVDCYLRTSECLYRILHIPTFRCDYEAVWDPDREPDPAFLVQLKLVLAIGAPSYDSTFSLRASAMQWVYEAQTWLSVPEFKHRLGIPSLQSTLLLLLAREATGVGEDMIWSSTGSAFRMAMAMGLHRDPAGLGPKTTSPLVVEMRRRLWNTILEISLRSSLDSGGPPLFSLDDFDTEPPGNYDDEQLTSESNERPIPKPDDQFTQTTIAIALRRLLPQRLAIAKYLNDLASRGTYTETLKLDSEFRAASKAITRTLQACKASSSSSSSSSSPHTPVGPSEIELRAIDILLGRYLHSLHLPFFGPALHEAAFAFSRKVVVESSLRVWRAAFPTPLTAPITPSHGPSHPSPASNGSNNNNHDDLLSRRAISASGFFQTVAVHAFVAAAVELKTLLREEREQSAFVGLGLGPVKMRPDLVAVLHSFKVWAWKSLEAGETNAKGYMIACTVSAHVEALHRGLGHEEVAKAVIEAAEQSQERALAFFEEVVAKGEVQGGGVSDTERGAAGLGATEPVAQADLMMGDWTDYMVSR